MVKKVYLGGQLLGDGLFAEPALRAYSQQCGKPIDLVLNGPIRELYEDNPYVNLYPDNTEVELNDEWIRVTPNAAFSFVNPLNPHIVSGFFHQLGLNCNDYDNKPRLYFTIAPPSSAPGSEYFCIAPFSASCSVHGSGVPNKTISIAWWEELVRTLDYPVISLGNAKEPDVFGSVNLRGKPLKEVASVLKHSAAVIAGDTGITAIAAALDCNIILLNAALPYRMIAPKSAGKVAIVQSLLPPSWEVPEVVEAINGVLQRAKESN